MHFTYLHKGNTNALLNQPEILVEDTTDFEFRRQSVDEHNRYRCQHQNTPMLREHFELVIFAQV